MNISFGDNNSINVDFSVTTTNIVSINAQLKTILADMQTFEPAQIIALKNELNSLYLTLNNFDKFLSEYEELREEVYL